MTLATELLADIENRFAHHPPTSDVVAEAHGKIRSIVKEATKAALEVALSIAPYGAEVELALKDFDKASMWLNAHVARNQVAPAAPVVDTKAETVAPADTSVDKTEADIASAQVTEPSPGPVSDTAVASGLVATTEPAPPAVTEPAPVPDVAGGDVNAASVGPCEEVNTPPVAEVAPVGPPVPAAAASPGSGTAAIPSGVDPNRTL